MTQNEALSPKNTSATTMDIRQRLPFVITYNPALSSVSFANTFTFSLPKCYQIRTCLLPFDVATIEAIFSYVLNYATLHYTTILGLLPIWQQQCSICAYISIGHNTYTLHSTGETRSIIHNIDCDSKTVFFMIHIRDMFLSKIEKTIGI